MTDANGSIRHLTPDDLFRIWVVSDPQVSPDGTMVAWVETRPDKDQDTYLGAIWVAPTTGGTARRLTSGSFRDSSPRWSPDGESLAFVSNRPGKPLPKSESGESKRKTTEKSDSSKPLSQIWVIAISGGEASQVTSHPGGASQPAWAPDGGSLAFVGQDATDENDRDQLPTSLGPVADEREVRSINYRFDGVGFRDTFSHIWTVTVDGDNAQQLTTGFTNDSAPAWSPDGRTIAFAGNRSDRPQVTWNCSQILTVPAEGGDVSILTETDASFGSPRWSPDGSRIAFLGHLGTLPGLNTHLWTVSVDGSNACDETSKVDLSFTDEGMSDLFGGGDGSPQWVDNSTIRLLASASGETQVHEVSLESGEVAQLTTGKHRIAGFGSIGSDLIVLRGLIDRPFELERWAEGAIQSAFSTSNESFDATLMAAIELDVTSPDGTPIQAWLLPPVGFDSTSAKQYPVIVQIHGGPHAMYSQAIFHEMQLMSARGYAVAFCNPRGSSGYGEKFTTCTRGTWGESDMPDVMAMVDVVSRLDWIDSNRLGITGGSYGGYLTNWIVGHDDRFKAAVTQRCVSNFYSFFGTSDIGSTFGVHEFDGLPWTDEDKLFKYSPIRYVDRITTPLLILHSERDLRCPIEQAEQMFAALKYLDRDVKFVRIPEESHDLSRTGTPSRRLARLHHLIGWFDTYLAG